jgi:hypothetical protein
LRLRSKFCVVIAVAAACLLPGAAFAGAKLPSDSWFGIYMTGQKMGYMRLAVTKTRFRDRDCFKVENFVRTRLVLLRVNVQQDVKTVMYTDDHFTPFFETFEMASGGRKTTVEADFTSKEVKCKVITDSSTSNKKVPIPTGASLVGDSMYALGADTLKVGLKARMYYFNTLTLSIDPIDVEVLRTEQIEIKDRKYDTFVVRNGTPMGDVTSWQTADGALIKTIGLMGVTIQVESQTEAKSGVDSDYVPPADLAVMTSVKANIDLTKPEKLHRLVVKLTGKLEKRMAISDGWQTVKWLDPVDGESVAQFTIESKPFDPKQSAQLPISSPDVAAFKVATPYVDADSPEIKSQAAEIVGGEKSAYQAAVKIRGWVSSHMKPRADMGIARPGADILKERSGVCRDYSILFASLSRAAGIPTKVIAGLVYINGGFYYHAWDECYVGKWVAFDATLGREFVDATHIKLAEGGATNMFDMATVFGSLKADIMEFK